MSAPTVPSTHAQPSTTQQRTARLAELARKIEKGEKNVQELQRTLSSIESSMEEAWNGMDAVDWPSKMQSQSEYHQLKARQQHYKPALEALSTKLEASRAEQARIQAEEDSFWPSSGSFWDNVTRALSSVTAPFV